MLWTEYFRHTAQSPSDTWRIHCHTPAWHVSSICTGQSIRVWCTPPTHRHTPSFSPGGGPSDTSRTSQRPRSSTSASNERSIRGLWRLKVTRSPELQGQEQGTDRCRIHQAGEAAGKQGIHWQLYLRAHSSRPAGTGVQHCAINCITWLQVEFNMKTKWSVKSPEGGKVRMKGQKISLAV